MFIKFHDKKYPMEKFDKRTRYEIYKEEVENDENYTMIVYPRVNLSEKNNVFFLSGIGNKNTVTCNEMGYYAINKSDRYGFNNDDKIWDEKEIDILLLGDSFAYGECVKREDNIPSKIIEQNPNLKIINLGMGGNGPLIEYATFREFKPFLFKNLIWIYYEGNDLKDLNNELVNSILIKYLEDYQFTQNLMLNHKSVEKKIENKTSNLVESYDQGLFKDFKLLKFLKLFRTRYLLIPKKDELPYHKLEDILTKVNKDLSSDQNFYLMYIPSHKNFIKKNKNENYFKLKSFLTKESIIMIDLFEELKISEKDYKKFTPFGAGEGHFSKFGYQEIAKLIFKKMYK